MTTLMSKPEAASKTQDLSAQEAAIQSGKAALHGNVTDRVLRLFEGQEGVRPLPETAVPGRRLLCRGRP